MARALFLFARLFVTVEVFELVGAAAITAGIVLLAGWAWGLIAVGVLALVKSFDLSVQKGR